jgi:hypothetical protein
MEQLGRSGIIKIKKLKRLGETRAGGREGSIGSPQKKRKKRRKDREGEKKTVVGENKRREKRIAPAKKDSHRTMDHQNQRCLTRF